eukprot:g280.t1
MVVCTYCNNDVIAEEDYAAGCTYCPSCGAVLVEGTYEQGFTFGEDGTMIGQIISDEHKPQKGEISERGFHEISLLVDQLRIHPRDDTIDAALRLYKMAVSRGFLKGRRSNQVAACCIYIMCRTEKHPYLLIDFSDCLRLNVYVLGSVFLDICALFKLDHHPIFLSPVDPSLFIHRYVDRLRFGNKTSVVTQTALKLIKSMKRDWIQTGRKPSGICAAALFIASHIHGVPKMKRDIIHVARIGVSTVAKRLTEFSSTAPGKLTASEFNLEAEKMEQLEQVLLSGPSVDTRGPQGIGCHHLDNGAEYFASGMCKECYIQYIKISGGIHEGTADPPAFVHTNKKRGGGIGVKKMLKLTEDYEANEAGQRFLEMEMQQAPEAEEVEAEMNAALSCQQIETFISSVHGDASQRILDIPPTEANPVQSTEPETSGVQGQEEVEEDLPFDEEEEEEEGEDAIIIDDLEEISYESISDYLLPQEEADQKRLWWNELHEDFLKKQALRKEKPVEKGKKRKRQSKKKTVNKEYSSALEAVKSVLEEKGLSSKINYDNLEALFNEDLTRQGEPKSPEKDQSGPSNPLWDDDAIQQEDHKKDSFWKRSLSCKKSERKTGRRLDGLFD